MSEWLINQNIWLLSHQEIKGEMDRKGVLLNDSGHKLNLYHSTYSSISFLMNIQYWTFIYLILKKD